MKKIQAAVLSLILLAATAVSAAEIRVAVASNFTGAIKEISTLFQQKTGERVILVFGSTGKHYAQIKNGAPFDIFLAADARRPKLLEEEGIAVAGSRFTYAMGTLVLWSADPKYIDDGAALLQRGGFSHLAFANPKLAPYGQAAEEVLQKLGVWQDLEPSYVRGQNISQVLQFVTSGNAELGFIALSQARGLDADERGSMWVVPQSMYKPIKQQAVLLKESELSKEFYRFLSSEEAIRIIKKFGYSTL